LYWSKIKDKYPTANVVPPLEFKIEEFGKEAKIQQWFEFKLNQAPDVRYLYVAEDNSTLVQLQNNKFLRNWRRISPDKEYPSYRVTKPAFVAAWQQFCEFLDEQKLPKPQVLQCEVTYVNQIDASSGWNAFTDLIDGMADLPASESSGFFPDPESGGLNVQYLMPENRGRLYASLQHLIKIDTREVLQISLTARGKPLSSDLADVMQWFDLGHEWVVRGFDEITSSKMKEVWKRRA